MMNRIFNLEQGEEQKEKVLANVQASIVFSGANLWILACAIMIASVGLNVNSTAVVIGAMLISPLMGPIVGAGFALAMFDFVLLRKALKNLGISTLIGLVVSFVYFSVSPFKEAQSEILSRTAPNIYDVLIAFFGGLVGVIAVTRVEKGNPIPGVAIATALMPPLCTAGYGLATGNFTFLAGALFLYTINCVFICLATYFIAKLLKYPAIGFVDEKQERRIRTWVSVITISMIVPSVYFAYQFIQEQRFKEKVNEFVSQEFESRGYTILYRKTSYTPAGPRKLELAFLARKFTGEEIKAENEKLANYGLHQTQLVIRQDSAFLARASAGKIETNEADPAQNRMINELKTELDQYRIEAENILPEARAIIPELQSLSVSRQKILTAQDSAYFMPVALYQTEKPLKTAQEEILRTWLKVKMKTDTVEIFRRK